MKKSQSERILAWLKRGKKIDDLIAFTKFGCRRLSARIHELRRAHDIADQYVKKNGAHYKQYWLA
jgi:hypothetical protein